MQMAVRDKDLSVLPPTKEGEGPTKPGKIRSLRSIIGERIKTLLRSGLQVKSVVVDADKTVLSPLRQAQIDGLPGLITGFVRLEEVMTNSAGQEIEPQCRGY